MRDFQILDQKGHTEVAMGMEGRAVVQDYCATGRESRDKPVPHHPGCGCEVEHAVSRPDIAV